MLTDTPPSVESDSRADKLPSVQDVPRRRKLPAPPRPGPVLRWVTSTLLLLLFVSFLSYSLLELVPGDPARSIAGIDASPEQVEEVRVSLGLDKPFLERFWIWLGDALTGDFGTSLASSQSVGDAVWGSVPPTLSLMFVALLIAVPIGLALGVVSALWPSSWVGRSASVLSSVGISVPNYWLGLLLIIAFAVNFQSLPVSGYEPMSSGIWTWAKHLVLPGIALSARPASEIARHTRASVASTLAGDHVRTARSKGLAEGSVFRRHVVRNAAAPVITVIGLQMAAVLSGTVIIETIFAIPGTGRLALQAVRQRDIPIIQAIVLVSVVLVVVVNTLVDGTYRLIDPRLRQAGDGGRRQPAADADEMASEEA